jgi:hypothetical protein
MRMTFLGRICRRNKNSDRSSIVETPVGVRRFLVRGVKVFCILGGMSDVEEGILIHRVWEIGVLIVVDSLEEEEPASEEREAGEPTHLDLRSSKESQGGCFKTGCSKSRGRG